MNIVYLLTNIDKEEYPNKYIGSKVECMIIDVDGLPTMMSIKDNSLYYGSSMNRIMIEDMKRGDRFSVSIIEECPDRTILRDLESKILKERMCAQSDEYYNMSNNAFSSENRLDYPSNMFGETVREVSSQMSSMSKRDNRAKECGFSNYGDLYFHIHDRYVKGESRIDISLSLGQERHFAARYLKDFDMDKAIKELDEAEGQKALLRDLWSKKATLKKISDLTGYERVTIRKVVGDFTFSDRWRVAMSLGLTKEELEIEVTKQILDGKGYVQVSKEMGLCLESVKRYFMRCVRSRLKSSDL